MSCCPTLRLTIAWQMLPGQHVPNSARLSSTLERANVVSQSQCGVMPCACAAETGAGDFLWQQHKVAPYCFDLNTPAGLSSKCSACFVTPPIACRHAMSCLYRQQSPPESHPDCSRPMSGARLFLCAAASDQAVQLAGAGMYIWSQTQAHRDDGGSTS